MAKKAILIDVSRYQTSIDKRVLRDGGVSGVIAKATQGDYKVDSLMSQHLNGCKILGMVTGVYHWVDPCISPELQANYFIKATTPVNPDFLALDVEQYWEDWNEWNKQNIIKKFSSKEIFDNLVKVYNACRKQTDKRIVIYSRVSFFKDYAPDVIPWLVDKDLWLAQYPYKPGVVNLSSWQELDNYLPVTTDPNLPSGSKTWKLWQFSGDKFTLPGVYGYANARSAVDLNFYNGTEAELNAWIGGSSVTPEPPLIDDEDNKGEIYYLGSTSMNIRTSPNTNAMKIGLLDAHSKVKVKRIVGRDVWVELENGGYVALKINDNEYGEIF